MLSLLFAVGIGQAPDVATVIAGGQGELTTSAGRYPLGDLAYTRSSLGRGAITFQAGSGAVTLSGADSDHPDPRTYRLSVDVMQARTLRHAEARCQLRLSADLQRYERLTCRGTLRPERERFAVTWAGDGRPLRLAP